MKSLPASCWSLCNAQLWQKINKGCYMCDVLANVYSRINLKCGSADITMPLSSPPSPSFSYLHCPLLQPFNLPLSISSLFTVHSVCGLPTLTTLKSFIKKPINSTRTFAYRHTCTCMCVCILWTHVVVLDRSCLCIGKFAHVYNAYGMCVYVLWTCANA